MKLKDLKERGKIYDSIGSLPSSIIHKRYDPSCDDWVNEDDDWVLSITGAPQSIYPHPGPTRKYRVGYVLHGYEGEKQVIPFESEVYEDMRALEVDLGGGYFGDSLVELIDRLRRWLEREKVEENS